MLQKLTKALEKPKANEILYILDNLEGMQLLLAITQVKASLQNTKGLTKQLLTWILEDQSKRIKNATKTTSTS
jgi:hypothetical protein